MSSIRQCTLSALLWKITFLNSSLHSTVISSLQLGSQHACPNVSSDLNTPHPSLYSYQCLSSCTLQFIQAFPLVLDHSRILPSIIYFHALISNPLYIKLSDSTFRKINHELTSLPLLKLFLVLLSLPQTFQDLIKILQFSSDIIPTLVLISKKHAMLD